MKKIGRYMVLLLLFITLPLKAQNDKFFQDLSNIKGVTSVIISETMLSLIGGNSDMIDIDNFDVKGILSKLKSIQILNSETAQSTKEMRQKIQTYLDKVSVMPIMSVKEDDEKTLIYFIEPKGKKDYAQLILFVDETDEISFISMSGTFKIEDLKGMMEQVK
ncbi:hypothetical protein Bcop_1777 [Bacteroides coprosuis DSM 18011]|uniref:DUF4252 domain-containing protein n=1 Tax=Bacteroides coprosuis DSM 18011 TaxID=679937 RepID=F3ZRF9_9BACE|nr:MULTISPECIES: DUF4252 domain-containing protein [Bacteroides]EGJ71967.1 hypothetical protein Bcop_1777 [Bacteroides coprosuis DSM 18011]HJD91882.1 DUF4252 domain-containing protein [Bacteroides coprosuis]